jgi:predicted Ser/Thr protein kinase
MKTNPIDPTPPPTATCPVCGAPLPAGALAGLCPACLLAQGSETHTHAPPERSAFQPPSLQQVGRLFPQLEILGLIGAGGMGAVYKARQPALDRLIALKILPPQETGGANFADRFNHEARALARLNHPNIVAVYEFGKTEGMHYFIMEYVDGANLRQLEKAGALAPTEALRIVPQICDALQYAHDEGVVHRDIKPENVLLNRRGQVKIADFGLAKILGMDGQWLRLTADHTVMGTPHYMAPEQVERPLSVDHRADIYSLGVVFYEMLTGDLPLGRFPPPSKRVRDVQLDVRLDEVVLRALENDPERRYQKASEVKEGVASVVNTPPGSADAAAPESATKPEPRVLRWAGSPVVVERDGEREVSYNGALGAIAIALLCVTAAFLLVRITTGIEHVSPRIGMLSALLITFWGIHRTLNRPDTAEAPRHTARGTLILHPASRFRLRPGFLPLAALFAFVVGFHFLKTEIINPRLTGSQSTTRVARTANDADIRGAMTAPLPGGGTVEMLAVAEAHPAPNGWWRPDGTPITTHRYIAEGLPSLDATNLLYRFFIVRMRDLPQDASGPYLHIAPAQSSSGGGTLLTDGAPMPDGQLYAATFQPAAESATIRLGFGWDPWQVVASHHPRHQTSTQIRHPGDRTWESSVHQAADGPDGARITIVLSGTINTDDWTTRVVAVDSRDEVHSHSIGSGTPMPSAQTWTYTFRDLTLDEIKEFQVQVRPIHWLEFRRIALHPDRPVPAPRPPAFGPVHELTFNGFLDFDSGRTGDAPPDLAAPHTTPTLHTLRGDILWQRETGYDAAAGTNRMYTLNLRCVALDDPDWDRISPAELIDRYHNGMFLPESLAAWPGPDDLPTTYGFRTREYGTGILQLMRFGETEPGVHLRYRLVEYPDGVLP